MEQEIDIKDYQAERTQYLWKCCAIIGIIGWLLLLCGVGFIVGSVVYVFQMGEFEAVPAVRMAHFDEEGHITGIIYPDTKIAECVQCWYGENCQNFNETCTVMVGSDQPQLLSEYWVVNYPREHSTQIPLSYRVPYQDSEPYYFTENNTEGIRGTINQLIRKIHDKYNNVDTEGKYLVFGVGSSQIISAAGRYYSQKRGKPLVHFANVPFNYYYRTRCDVLGPSFCSGFSDDQNLTSSDVFEYVTVPNNPDGRYRERYYDTNDAWVSDLVHYWPNLKGYDIEIIPISAPVTVFSFSKFTGHAGSRFGWGFVEDKEMALSMGKWLSLTGEIGVEQLYRSKTILEFMLTGKGDEFYSGTLEKLRKNWVRMEIAVELNPYGYMILHGNQDTQYAWVEITSKLSEEEIMNRFKEQRLSPFPGSAFGAPNYVRFNLLEHPTSFNFLIYQFYKVDCSP